MVKSPSAAASASASATAEQRSTNEVKYKGVRKRKWGKYVSEIRLPNSRDRIWLGSYETAERAARAFDAALFCLRGHNAKFNFPNDPPNMVGCQSLTPAEIQAVAQHYSNQPRTASPPPPGGGDESKAVAVEEDMSPSSNSEGAEPMDTIDWSFLDVLDSDRVGNAGHVSDFGLFHEPVDMYMPSSHLAERCDDEDEDDNDGSGNYGGNVQSFLWNF